MTTELFYLFLTTILLTILWIPYSVGQIMTGGPISPEEYVKLRDAGNLPDWARRANRMHINLVEQFGAFVALVVIAHLANLSNSTTEIAAAAFFWARVAHAVIFLIGFKYMMARTLAFAVAFASLLVFAWQIAIAI